MKNVQIIDGAANCSYDIFAMSDEEYSIIFPEFGQDIEFIEDLIDRLGDDKVGIIMEKIWKRPIKKQDVTGIHGTIFYELLWKKRYYPTKKVTR